MYNGRSVRGYKFAGVHMCKVQVYMQGYICARYKCAGVHMCKVQVYGGTSVRCTTGLHMNYMYKCTAVEVHDGFIGAL